LRKLRRLRWRSRKAARVERRFFETVFLGFLQEMTAEIAPAPRSREKTAGHSGGSSEPEARAG